MNRADLISHLLRSTDALKKALFQHACQHNHGAPQLSHAQIHVLFFLDQSTRLSSKELAEQLHVTPSAATQFVHSLESLALVMRQQDPSDRRRFFLDLTKKGKELVSVMRRDRARVMEQALQVLSDDELQQLQSLQEKILHSLSRV